MVKVALQAGGVVVAVASIGRTSDTFDVGNDTVLCFGGGGQIQVFHHGNAPGVIATQPRGNEPRGEASCGLNGIR